MYPENVCRACLSETNQMRSLNAKIEGETRTILDVLSFVANINIITGNGLPKLVCSDCESILYKADAFKRRCLESEMILSQQPSLTTQGHVSEEISSTMMIKNEKLLEIGDKDLKETSHTSVCSVKPVESSLDMIFDTFPAQDEKVNLFSETASSKSDKNLSNISKNVENLTDIVKEEDNETQNDMSFDFEDTFETPVEFKVKVPVEKKIKLVTCSCGTVFNKKIEYKNHLKTNCTGYKKSLKIKMENKSQHGRHIFIKKRIVCPECNLEFATVKACKLHQRKHKNLDNGHFECTMCLRKFNRKSSYTNHMKQHDLKSNIKYTCKSCKREFQHKAHLDNHVLTVHTRDKGYLCEICMVRFETQESLDVHKENHPIEKKHQCHICKKSFYMSSTLNDHLRVHTGEKPFLCSICGRGFSQKTNLAQHMRRHQGLKPFKCEECNKRFVSKGELVAHNRKHSGAHPFVCDDCGSGFTTSSSLVKHRRVHTGERPYACDLCPMRFAASGTLKNHRRTHTGEKPFQCSYCEKAFVQRHDLVAHIRGHTGERPYTCHCGQAFRKGSALKAHVRLHGKDTL